MATAIPNPDPEAPSSVAFISEEYFMLIEDFGEIEAGTRLQLAGHSPDVIGKHPDDEMASVVYANTYGSIMVTVPTNLFVPYVTTV